MWMPPWCLPPPLLRGKCSKWGNCPGQAEQNQAGSVTPGRQPARTRGSVGSTQPLASPLLASAQPSLTPRGPGGLAFMPRPRGSPCRQQSKICTGKGNPVLPPLPSLGQRSRGLCCRLGVCALVARPSPSPTCVPTPFQTGDRGQALPLSNPFFLASHAPSHWGGPEASPRVLLTLGGGEKHHEPLPSLTFLALACICQEAMEMEHVSRDLWGLCFTSENDLKTVRKITLLEQNPEN